MKVPMRQVAQVGRTASPEQAVLQKFLVLKVSQVYTGVFICKLFVCLLILIRTNFARHIHTHLSHLCISTCRSECVCTYVHAL